MLAGQEVGGPRHPVCQRVLLMMGPLQLRNRWVVPAKGSGGRCQREPCLPSPSARGPSRGPRCLRISLLGRLARHWLQLSAKPKRYPLQLACPKLLGPVSLLLATAVAAGVAWRLHASQEYSRLVAGPGLDGMRAARGPLLAAARPGLVWVLCAWREVVRAVKWSVWDGVRSNPLGSKRERAGASSCMYRRGRGVVAYGGSHGRDKRGEGQWGRAARH